MAAAPLSCSFRAAEHAVDGLFCAPTTNPQAPPTRAPGYRARHAPRASYLAPPLPRNGEHKNP